MRKTNTRNGRRDKTARKIAEKAALARPGHSGNPSFTKAGPGRYAVEGKGR